MSEQNVFDLYKLDDRVALITGGSKGLGKAMALALGAKGYAVALNYCNGREKAEETFAEFTAQGHSGISSKPTPSTLTTSPACARRCERPSARSTS